MNKYFFYPIGILILIAVFSFKNSTILEKDTIKNPPIFKKGTFWKIKNRQLTDAVAEKTNHAVMVSCYIDGETIYKGVEVYEATYIIHRENKVSKRFIQKSNLKLIDAVGVWSNYYNDTMTIEYELLNFPMYEGKTWKSIIKQQKRPRQEIFSSDAAFEVEAVQDTTFYIQNKKIKTQAYFIKGTLTTPKKETFISQYIYLAPTKNFPGSCPVNMQGEFSKKLKRVDRRGNGAYQWVFSIEDFNW